MSVITEPVTVQAPARDARAFWRILLAVGAALPFLAKGVEYIISPLRGGEPFAEMVEAYATHRDLVPLLFALDAVFTLCLIPATVALAWVARRRAPVLTAVGGFLGLFGFFAVLPRGVDDMGMAQVTVDEKLDVATVGRINEALWANPLPSIAILFFLIGLVIGLPLLGIALWRGRVVPRWAAGCLILGTATHPFIPGGVAAGIGLIVAGIGFLAVSGVLLRMGNDEFDRPPVSARTGG